MSGADNDIDRDVLSARLEEAAARDQGRESSADGLSVPMAESEASNTEVETSVANSKKKKPRLHWDEENLLSNALEKARNPYPKIDEPKTPYHAMSGSEGSCSSGSAPQSPGSPAFISRDQLVGFTDLEEKRNSGSSDSHHRTVHISEDASASSGGESSPRSREEFETKRKLHYKHEYPRAPLAEVNEDEDNSAEHGGLDAEAYDDEDEDDAANDMDEDAPEQHNGVNGASDELSSPENEKRPATVCDVPGTSDGV